MIFPALRFRVVKDTWWGSPPWLVQVEVSGRSITSMRCDTHSGAMEWIDSYLRALR
jgi:hypothetical protein